MSTERGKFRKKGAPAMDTLFLCGKKRLNHQKSLNHLIYKKP